VPCTDKGHRQEWVYNVQYADGSEKDFFIPCKPIIIDFKDMDLLSLINTCPHQKFYTNSNDIVSAFGTEEARNAHLNTILRLLHVTKSTSFAEEVKLLLGLL
jgi:hypothetical protein